MDIDQHDKVLRLSIRSEMNLVDELLRNVKSFMREHEISDQSPVKIVLRELLINAIEHGNNKVPDKKVSCEIELIENRRFRIVVRDEGDGFDYKNLCMDMSDDPRKKRHRGYVLVNSLADEIRFNETGNEVTVFIGIPEKTQYQVIKTSDGSQVITPTGDITASTADEFRSILLGLNNGGHAHFVFDFKSVEEVDSVGLSVMVALSNSVEETGGKVEIFNISPKCQELMAILHLDTIFDLRMNERPSDI